MSRIFSSGSNDSTLYDRSLDTDQSHSFTLDAATEFLLGRSVDSLHNPQTGFAEAFAEVQATQSVIARAG